MLGLRTRAIVIGVFFAAPAMAQTVDSVAGVVAPARLATTAPAISTGELVRVWASRPRLDGAIANFARIDSNLVITGQAPFGTPPREVAVPVNLIERLEVYRGRPRSAGRIMTGAVIGALVGAGVGAGLTHFIECGGACDKTGTLQPTASPRLGAFIGAPVGALLGGVVGGMKRPRWEPVALTIR